MQSSIDLLLANPPYIPSHLVSRPLDNAYEGTAVITDLLVGEGPRSLGRNGVGFLLYSSLCAGVVDDYCERAEVVVEQIGVPRWVPLDLREIARDPRWISYLLRHHQLAARPEHPEYLYWHRLAMAAFYHPENRHRGQDGRIFPKVPSG